MHIKLHWIATGLTWMKSVIDFVSMNLGNVFYYPQTKKVYTPNTGVLGDLTTLKSEKGGENDEN